MLTQNSHKSPLYDIFISYRNTHLPWVEVLGKNLQAQGYTVFIDAWELTGGDNFTSKIFDALANSRFALLLATPEAAESGWVQEEYEYMFNRAKRQDGFRWIPIVLGEFPDFPFLSNVQAVDFKNSSEKHYRTAFQKLLCGLTQEAPGAQPYFSGPLTLPLPEQATPDVSHNDNATAFVQKVCDRLDTNTPLMVLSQADTSTQHYIKALKQALTKQTRSTFLHLFPPASVHADSAAYFGRLAKQCHFSSDISSSWEWADAVRERLDNGDKLVLLITGFENGAYENSGELAGELRGLLESGYSDQLKLIIMGREKLAAAKYQNGIHSLLNDLEEMPLDDVNVQDLQDLYLKRYPSVQLDDATAHDLLDYTGKHPRLLEISIQALSKGKSDWQTELKQSAIFPQLFSRFRDEIERPLLNELLNKDILGRFETWPQDPLLRRLYWNNLITNCEGQYVWRCFLIQQNGKELFNW